MNKKANEVIDLLGGTLATAKILNTKMPVISNYRNNGIPKFALEVLKIKHKKALAVVNEIEEATAKRG